MKLNISDIDVRVIDQRIGVGVGGMNTVIRLLHKPTGIIIEMPRLTKSMHYDREVAIAALELALMGVPEQHEDHSDD